MALTVTDMRASREFYAGTLGLPVLDGNDHYCALLTGSRELSALILTTHDQTQEGRFSEFRVGLDHISFAVTDMPAFEAWQSRLAEQGVPCDRRHSEWGHHLNFRDPDNIAVELVLMDPDSGVQEILSKAE